MNVATDLANAGMMLALLSAPVPAAAKTWTVFGMQLGQPVTLPTCKHTILPGGTESKYTYERDPAQMCHEPQIQLSDAPWQRGDVDFPLKQMPLILSLNSGYTEIVDGKLEGLRFDTLGYASTEGIITELKSKFGNPTRVKKTTATVSEIAVPAIEAVWALPDLYVDYVNIGESVDHGILVIETPIMRSVRALHEREQASQRKAL